ncbi:hypothetical protein G5714_022203 [Onychostoma macrolepis]|uniref:WW domain binding protein 1 n=1 Tax=Onychostoma macrolepis TaxID=369639 RepID=A0A7J6BMM0_9TELE|nr:hypothetical protein G5714_022203 [Onychostoma macrolepis]
MEYHSSGTLPLLGSPRYCPGTNSASGYLCQTGHCCQETGCCTYYYELWWFWLLWSVLILFSCCCAYRHRQAKQRVQQQQRQREINLMAYHGACSYPSSMFDLSFLASLKLPSYEEVAAQPSTPPLPTAPLPIHEAPPTPAQVTCCHRRALTTTPAAPATPAVRHRPVAPPLLRPNSQTKLILATPPHPPSASLATPTQQSCTLSAFPYRQSAKAANRQHKAQPRSWRWSFQAPPLWIPRGTTNQ